MLLHWHHMTAGDLQLSIWCLFYNSNAAVQ